MEKDPTYEQASSPRAVGGIRYQFSTRENIQMSMFGMDFLKRLGTELQVGDDQPDALYFEGGYAFLASTKAGEMVLRENYELQRSLGAQVRFFKPAELAAHFPWLNCEGIVAGCVGVEGEGWFDPWILLTSLRRKAIDMGVHYCHGSVTGVARNGLSVSGVRVQRHGSEEDEIDIGCDYLVNAGGAFAADIAAMAGIGSGVTFHNVENPYRDQWTSDPRLAVSLPVQPRRRMVFTFEQMDGPIHDCPLLVDPSGAYVLRGGSKGRFVCGRGPDEDPDTDSFELDHDYFQETIWPALAHRIPVFESLKVQAGWAGLYDMNTFDCNGIIGLHPVIRNLVFANGFSGHGIQQGPAAGRAVSELIADGQSHSIDLTRFGFERVIDQTTHF